MVSIPALVPSRPGRAAAQGARALASALLPVLVAAVAWEGAVTLFGIKPYYLPSLVVVLRVLESGVGFYASAFLHTLVETLVGFAAGTVIGIGSGLVFLQARILREMLFPFFVVSQTIPVIAFGAIVVLWFGNTLLAKAVIAFYLTFFPVTVNTLRGLTAVDERQVALMRSFGAGRAQILWKLRFPYALPYIFVALRLSAALSLAGAMVGEWFGDTNGLGTLLLNGLFNEQIPSLWATILCSALLGTTFYGVIAAIERVVVTWRTELQ